MFAICDMGGATWLIGHKAEIHDTEHQTIDSNVPNFECSPHLVLPSHATDGPVHYWWN